MLASGGGMMRLQALSCLGLIMVAAISKAAALDNGLGLTPPMGWNSWNHFRGDINEQLIKETADAMVSSGLAEVGYNYLNLDDCWMASERDSNGNLMTADWQFPHGLKAVSDYVHSKGLKFGLYADGGLKTCGGRAGSLGYEYQDAAFFAANEVDYLKYDSCYENNVRPQVRFVIMRDALNASGRAIYYSISNWGQKFPAIWPGHEVANSWRTHGDITDEWSIMTEQADYNNLYAKWARPGGWNDPDMLEVGNGGMTAAEYRGHFSIWALAKAPLMIGCDVRNMSDETLAILTNKEVIAVNQDSLGIQGKRMWPFSWRGSYEVWSGPVSGKKWAMVVWNRSKRPARIYAPCWAAQLPSAYFVARDIWQHKTYPREFRGGMSVNVGPHDAAMFILTPVPQSPPCRTPFWVYPVRVFSWLWLLEPLDMLNIVVTLIIIGTLLYTATKFQKPIFALGRSAVVLLSSTWQLVEARCRPLLERWWPYHRVPLMPN